MISMVPLVKQPARIRTRAGVSLVLSEHVPVFHWCCQNTCLGFIGAVRTRAGVSLVLSEHVPGFHWCCQNTCLGFIGAVDRMSQNTCLCFIGAQYITKIAPCHEESIIVTATRRKSLNGKLPKLATLHICLLFLLMAV